MAVQAAALEQQAILVTGQRAKVAEAATLQMLALMAAVEAEELEPKVELELTLWPGMGVQDVPLLSAALQSLTAAVVVEAGTRREAAEQEAQAAVALVLRLEQPQRTAQPTQVAAVAQVLIQAQGALGS
jgi:hypothetical protein